MNYDDLTWRWREEVLHEKRCQWTSIASDGRVARCILPLHLDGMHLLHLNDDDKDWRQRCQLEP